MRKIVWEEWKDPLAPLLKDNSKTLKDEDSENIAKYRDAVKTFGYDESEDDDDDYRMLKGPTDVIGACIVGPMGIVPINESNIPSKLFTFWMGHTNFDIDDEVALKIEATPGVESLDVFTRYRFRIAIGRAFEQKGVLSAIADTTCREQVTS